MFLAIGPGGVNLAVQSRPNLASQGEKSQEAANVRSHMLKCASSVPIAGIGDETLDVGLSEIG
jgi:hypothetical protein